MKTNKYKILAMSLLCTSAFLVSCSKDDNSSSTPVIDFTGTYVQQDQMARPAINTVFIAPGATKDAFNGTIPSLMGAAYQGIFQTRLEALNMSYTGTAKNLLGLTSSEFSGVLATDVLTVAKTGPTTFYNGTQVLTGRALADDVIDVELILIFGGIDAMANPGLTSDYVDANDKPFLASFPYLAAAW